MPGDWCERDWCDYAPGVTVNQGRFRCGKNNSNTKNGARRHGVDRRGRLTGVLALRRGATCIRLGLRDDPLRTRAFRRALVHRARVMAMGAASHASFRRRCPTSAHRYICRKQGGVQGKHRKSFGDPHGISRMLNWPIPCQTASDSNAIPSRAYPSQKPKRNYSVTSVVKSLFGIPVRNRIAIAGGRSAETRAPLDCASYLVPPPASTGCRACSC